MYVNAFKIKHICTVSKNFTLKLFNSHYSKMKILNFVLQK